MVISESGVKWVSGNAKRQCDRALYMQTCSRPARLDNLAARAETAALRWIFARTSGVICADCRLITRDSHSSWPIRGAPSAGVSVEDTALAAAMPWAR
jgi:hypothetical protein